MAQKITSKQLNPSGTVDANGWTVYDYGTWKEYTIAAPAAYTGAASLGGDQTGGPFGEVSSLPLPVGITNLSQVASCTMTGSVDADSLNSCIVRFTGSTISGTVLPLAYIRNTSPSASTIQFVRVRATIRK